MLFLSMLLSPAMAADLACDIYPTNTCASSVASVSRSGSRAVAHFDMNAGGWQRIDVFAKVCNPSGWVMHLSDSPSTNGYGGDAGTTDHDAEIYVFNGYDIHYYSSTDWSRSLFPDIDILGNSINGDAFDSSGCGYVRLAFLNATSAALPSEVQYDTDPLGLSGYQPAGSMRSLYGPRLGYTAAPSSSSTTRSIETDWEDRGLSDSNKWHVSVNGLVGSSSRTGSGVQEACVVLSTLTSATPASCL